MNVSLLLSSMMRFSAPILLAAIGALFCDCAGVTFIILEAQILLSCFFSVIGGVYFVHWLPVGCLDCFSFGLRNG